VTVSADSGTGNRVEGATYLAATVRERLAAAQSTLDAHPISLRDGRCITCGAEGGCVEREEAARIFARYGVLPRRCPGATRPELVGARRLAILRQPPALTEPSGLSR
jgi:hypothetical protein